eukprot:CAMPEP_0172368324 /NCGR_PEP_ID=MMETSP1060-20121228/26405_1 /TAXON_ID=37318 /ORGANISM="Pseudo-nitzschia pungens, Strain cf. cingulata" /LENGTH=337 /DNA_ID=CAMNT_0013092873 /DNA_START=71 /DNA_END=1084 /DNA_ORIENTATION=-
MTAKNKRKNVTSRMEKRLEREEKMKDIPVHDGENKYSDEEPPTLESSYKPFTTAQLGALVFLMTGVSKIYELTVALDEDESEAPSCMAYLNNDETCKHPHFKSLIQAKYYSAISLAGLVSVYVLQLWSSEYYFMKFMNCLSINPLFTTFLALSALPFTIDSPGEDGVISKTKMWELCAMLTILYGTVAPKSVDHLPFFTGKMEEGSVKHVSLQAASLCCLAGASFWDVCSVIYNGIYNTNGLQNALLDVPEAFPDTAKALVYFWMVDKIAMAILYAFAIVHLPIFKQRAILVAALGIKLCEYYMQLPRMNDPWRDQEATVYPMTMGLAVLSAVAWFM